MSTCKRGSDRRASVDEREHRLSRPRAHGAAPGNVAAACEPDWLIAPFVSRMGVTVLGAGWTRERFAVRFERQSRFSASAGLSTWCKWPTATREATSVSTRCARRRFASARGASRAIRRSSATMPARPALAGAAARRGAGQRLARRRVDRAGPRALREAEVFPRAITARRREAVAADATGAQGFGAAQAALMRRARRKTEKDARRGLEGRDSDRLSGELRASLGPWRSGREDGVRAMVRGDQPGAKAFEGAASVAPAERQAAAEAGRATSSSKAGARLGISM